MNNLSRKKFWRGFTLIEMMIVVAIVALLVAIAIPAFQRYIINSRAAEAPLNLKQISHGARVYFYDEHLNSNLVVLPSQFPRTVKKTPASGPCSNKKARYRSNPAIWSMTETWRALRFGISSTHYFQYQFVSKGAATKSKYSSYAYGNLDCDSKTSVYYLRARIDRSTGELAPLPLLVVNEGD